MKKLLIFLLLALVFIGCSSKIPIEVHENKEITINKNKKIVYLEFQNSSDEDIQIKQEVKEALKNKNYALATKLYEVDYYVFINIISAKTLEKEFAKENIFSNINLNLGLGKALGSHTSIGTSIGTSLGSIFSSSENKKEKVFQVVVDLNIDEYKNNELLKSKDKQIVLSAIAPEDKELLLKEIKNKILSEIENIF